MPDPAKKLKNFFSKACANLHYSPYVRHYLFTSNVKSSVSVSIVVSLLEIFMLVSIFTGAVDSGGMQNQTWVTNHVIAYIILLITSIAMLIYSILFLKSKIKSYFIGYLLKIIFIMIAITFGIYISYTSYDARGQVFAFITMELFSLCILVLHPINTFIVLTSSFALYLYFQNMIMPLSYSIKVNIFTAWIATLLSARNIHHQRRIEAQKGEEIEKINSQLRKNATINELTGIPNFFSFQQTTEKLLKDESVDISDMRFIFMDIENFKNYNEKFGFSKGNEFLKKTGGIVSEVFAGDTVAYFSDDHFIAFSSVKGLSKKLELVKEKIQAEEKSIHLGLKTGLYMPESRNIASNIALDYARYASSSIKKHSIHNVAEYNTHMDIAFSKKQYIINNIDSAIEKGYIQPFYQPLVWAKDGSLCGAEALARWIDPEFGLLSPADFIPILEEYHLIHKLDMHIMREVCRNIRAAYDSNLPILPTSINLSRLDFMLADPVKEVSDCINKYNIKKTDIHIEITESALADSPDEIMKALNSFREQGFSLWLDDFGSGYSSLNVLKDFSFDMMKLDMKFLLRFSDNQKTRPIISSMVELAKKIGMQTLSEGVESPEVFSYLREIGCERLQGYLFGKPMPPEEFRKKITSGEFKVSV